MIFISSNGANITLAASFLLAASLVSLCLSPPHPHPSGPVDSLPRDDVGVGSKAIRVRRLITLLLWLSHALIAMYYPSPPAGLCPNAGNLSGSLFTWSPYTITVLIVVIIAAPVRLLAFKQLGENFTFRLAKPKALVKTGMYAYVQHPSYPTIWLLSMVNFALFLRRDGIVGCVLPHWVVTWGLGMGSGIVWSTLLLEAGILGILGIVVRVKDEEAMLRKEFGSEWEAWHKKTMRFIPGVI